MAQQVAVVDGAQAKELEQVVLVGLDGVVQLAGVGGHELRHLGADETLVETHGHRLRKGVDVLVTDLLVDHCGQQPGGQAGVVGLLDNEGRRGPDGQLVELLGSGPVAQA